jgi:tripartite ATP-independent transporter DctM subunit
MGLLAFPAMLRAGYDIKLSAGAVTAGGCLGILIPPSIMLILYGATAGVSVVKLYAGAFFPGIMLALLYVLYVIIRAVLDPKVAPRLPESERSTNFLKTFRILLTSFFPLALLILAVLGSIVFGLATPTEAAAVGSLGGILLALAYRQLTWERFKEAVFLTARTSAMVCWLFVGSALFSAVFALLGGQEVIEKWVLSLGLNKFTFMLLAQVIIFLLGWPLEWTEIIVIFMPIFLPLLGHFEIDPLFFGLLVALNLQTAFLSPPVAMAAFYLKGVAPPYVTLNQIYAGMMPFMVIQVVALVLLYAFPQIGLWLPEILYK